MVSPLEETNKSIVKINPISSDPGTNVSHGRNKNMKRGYHKRSDRPRPQHVSPADMYKCAYVYSEKQKK
jgi:hypothetical protein